MSLKVTWKKGMRLSADIFNAHDDAVDDRFRLTMLPATASRFGLFTTPAPFELSVNIGNEYAEIISLSCHGVTKNGSLVDIEFDSNYSNTFNTRLAIPAAAESSEFLLVVRIPDKRWREINELYSEQAYTFELVGENTAVGNDMLPIGRLVHQYGWRLDETDFVPPCLYVSSHRKYIESYVIATDRLKRINDMCLSSANCIAHHLLLSVWNAASNGYITLDKTFDTLTPNQLFAEIQKVISAFVIGCATDEYLSLEEPEPFVMYMQRPCDNADIYGNITRGLELLSQIVVKMDNVCRMTETIKHAPIAEPPVREEPKPISKPTGRNRWNGIEI